MAVALIGGTLTATLLTLLVIPSFYDSIATARDEAIAKFEARGRRWNVPVAFVITLAEALAVLAMLRPAWRFLGCATRWLRRSALRR